MNADYIARIINFIDRDNDGIISLEEFQIFILNCLQMKNENSYKNFSLCF